VSFWSEIIEPIHNIYSGSNFCDLYCALIIGKLHTIGIVFHMVAIIFLNKDSEENVEISNLTNALDEAHIKNKDSQETMETSNLANASSEVQS
jgi:ArsR family metal-binding transcriptional regulator